MTDGQYTYDIAVSFAGEQRAYVERFVHACKRLGIRVLYDRDLSVDLWGKNLIFEFRRHFSGADVRYVVAFISAEFMAKPYPMDEFAAAVEQSFQRPEAHILPVRVGAVDVPAHLLNPAVGVLFADAHTPEQLAEQVRRKLDDPRTGSDTAFQPPRIAPASFNARHVNASALQQVRARFERSAAAALEPYGFSPHITGDAESLDIRVESAGRPVCGLSLWLDSSFGPDRLAMSFGWPTNDRRGVNGWVTADWDPDRRSEILVFEELGQPAEPLASADALAAALWQKIVRHIEQFTPSAGHERRAR